jgi:hypothetical protein
VAVLVAEPKRRAGQREDVCRRGTLLVGAALAVEVPMGPDTGPSRGVGYAAGVHHWKVGAIAPCALEGTRMGVSCGGPRRTGAREVRAVPALGNT